MKRKKYLKPNPESCVYSGNCEIKGCNGYGIGKGGGGSQRQTFGCYQPSLTNNNDTNKLDKLESRI